LTEAPDSYEVIYGRPRAFIIFISSKMAGGALAAERQAAIEAVEEFRPARPWAWEKDAPAGSIYAEDECVQRAGNSDALVLIVDDELTPVTGKEFEAAERGTATVIVLARRGANQNAELEHFIAEVREQAITKEFSGLDELKAEVDLALWEWFVRGGRTLGLQVQAQRKSSTDLALLETTELGSGSEGRSLREELERLRGEVKSGEAQTALAEIYSWAEMATEADHFPLAAILLAQLLKIIPSAEIDERSRGWILNLEGRVAGGIGSGDPNQFFEQMRQIGIAIEDTELISTAHQNLGVQAVIAHDHELARNHLKTSFELKQESDDVYGAIQVALNLCNVLIGEGSYEAAWNLLGEIDPFIRGPETSRLRSSIEGQRGLIRTHEKRFEEARELFSDSLRHARQANSSGRQALALQNLGANAMERGQQKEALRWYRKADAIAQNLEERSRMRILAGAIGTALGELGYWDEAAAEFARAARIAESLGDIPAEAEAWANVGACWLELGRPEEALRLVDETLADPRAERSPDSRAAQLRNLAEVLEQLERSEDALQRLEEAANLAEDPELEDAALQRAAEIALLHPGLGHQAEGYLRRSLALQRQSGTSVDAAWRAATIGAQLSNSSQAAKAPEFFTLALRVFSRNGDRRRAFHVRNDRGIAWSKTENLAAARKDMKAALELAVEIGDSNLEFQAEMNLGEIERRSERLDSSGEHLSRALALAEQSGDRADRAATLNQLGLLEVNRGDLEAAEAAYGDALTLAKELKDTTIQAEAFGGLGGVAYRRERFAEAARRFEQAIRKYGNVISTGLAEDLGGLALSRAARGEAREEELQRLIDVSGRLGWDQPCAEELAECGRLMHAESGDPDDAVSLQAMALSCALRSITADLSGGDNELADLLNFVLIRGTMWMSELPDYDDRKRQMLDEAIDNLNFDREAMSFLEGMIETIESVMNEG